MDSIENVYKRIGFHEVDEAERRRLIEFINLKLASLGAPIYGDPEDYQFMQLGRSLVDNLRAKNRLLAQHRCPADKYVEDFLAAYFEGVPGAEALRLPNQAFTLQKHGIARQLSLPPDSDTFNSDIISSYRVHNGICNNPAKDRRTTKGVFHVCEGGFTVPADKKEVPKQTYVRLFEEAMRPPSDLMRLPFTSTQEEQAELFVSLLLRPKVCPAVEGYMDEKRLEVRFFAPGNLVSNLDFVESIFGNAGDPFLPENDARLDTKHWSGHTGCVILAPHLVNLKKQDLGLPHYDEATERQRRDGMCWQTEDEKYNDGISFKITCRDHRGVVVTIIADNYFGYCKKEVKTMTSYATNLMGMCEEEHAGGALAFPRFDLGEDFELSSYFSETRHTFDEIVENYRDLMDVKPEGYGIDRQYDDIWYVPEDVRVSLRDQSITWTKDDQPQKIRLQSNHTYVLPSGYKVEMIKPQDGLRWRLVGTLAEGTNCHKPCTVSGGGKSEISKPITDAMLRGPIITYDFRRDFDQVEHICNKDYGKRYRHRFDPNKTSRPFLSADRSLGSAVRLLTPSPEYTDDYNEWLERIPRHVRELALVVKRCYKSSWEDEWAKRFSVDIVNGLPGHELKFRKEKLLKRYIRVGFTADGSWRTFGLRQDFFNAAKLQTEDDISVSIVVPSRYVGNLHSNLEQPAYKFVKNCEYRLFQRPDEAIVRGFDTTAEADFSRSGNFFSNYEPLTRDEAKEMLEDAIQFDQFSEPIQNVIRNFAEADAPAFCVSTSHPRVIDGKPTKNPRYLQNRPDLGDQRSLYLAKLGARLNRKTPIAEPVRFPVNAVLPGRRNNPADHKRGIRPLAVYSPIHYQELPELFMEFIASLTGKSPSTTGAGSEGALTKGPFNCLPPIIDLNNALVSYLLTSNPCFTTSAGFIGPNYRVDHDISLIIPEVWSRMFVSERDPKRLIEDGCLEPLYDFPHKGKTVAASRLGYRITERFVNLFFGRIFTNPMSLFDEEMLRPEKQSMDDFADGVDNIVTTQTRIAKLYFDDNTVELACPPLKALLHIMAFGDYDGRDQHDQSIRDLFTAEAMLESDWYQRRLETRQEAEKELWQRHVEYLQDYLVDENNGGSKMRSVVEQRLEEARRHLAFVEGDVDYFERLQGSLGTDPAVRNLHAPVQA